jgi:hypothetical protein
MRNDARPIGEHAPKSPVGGDHAPMQSEHSDRRDSLTHDRQSHIVNQQAEDRQPEQPDDPVMPSSDSALKTKI